MLDNRTLNYLVNGRLTNLNSENQPKPQIRIVNDRIEIKIGGKIDPVDGIMTYPTIGITITRKDVVVYDAREWNPTKRLGIDDPRGYQTIRTILNTMV